MHAMTTRSLGATAPSAPRAEDGMIVGNPATAAAPPRVDFRKSRRPTDILHLALMKGRDSGRLWILPNCIVSGCAEQAFRVVERADRPIGWRPGYFRATFDLSLGLMSALRSPSANWIPAR